MSDIKDITKVKSILGQVTREQLKHVDCFVGEKIGVFMPLTGQCLYAAVPFHAHPTYMFLIPFNEQTILVLEDKEIDLEQWKLYALAPNIKHHEKIFADIPRYLAVFIDKTLVENCLANYNAPEFNIFSGKGIKVESKLVEKIKQFILESDNNIPGTKEVIEGMELVICHQLIRNLLEVSYSGRQITDRLEVNKAVNFMKANFSADLTVERIAGEVDMSVAHFSRVFKQELGRTVIDYLNEIRIKAAKKMLLNETASITEIAHRCGFNSLSYMSTCFSDYNDLSPSDYRDMFQE